MNMISAIFKVKKHMEVLFMDNIFTETKVHSARLNKDFSVETYNKGNDVIVSTTSLKRIYEMLKMENGLTDSISSDVRSDNEGHVFYASVELTIKDKEGFCSTYIGEATSESLTTPISKAFPKSIAYNRAVCTATINYLQLPKRYHSEYPLSVDNDEKETISSEVAADTPIVDLSADNDQPVTGTIGTIPEMPVDASIKTEAEIEAEMEEQLPFNDGPKALVESSLKDDAEKNISAETSAVAAVSTTDNNTTEESNKEETVTNPAENTAPADDSATKDQQITEDMLVGFGKYAQTSIADFRNLIESGDALANKMLTLIKKGQLNDISHKDIINYIKNNM